MAKSLDPRSSKVRDILTCPICLSEFNDPVIIDCHHSFCRSCLDMHIQSNSTLNKTFSCPVCKHKNNVPLRGVSGFQKSFVVEQFRDVLKSTESDSSWYTNSKETGKQQEYPMCQSHPTEDLRFFCIECQSKICRDCKLSNHDGHTTQMIHERAKELKCNLKSMVENIDINLENFTMIRKKHNDNNVHLYDLKEKGVNSIRNQARAIKDQIDSLAKQLEETLEKHFEDSELSVESKLFESESMMGVLRDFKASVQRLIAIGQDHEVIANHDAMSDIYTAIKAKDVQYLMVADRLEKLDNLYAEGELREEDLGSMMGTVRSPTEMDPTKDFHHEIQIQQLTLQSILKPFRFNSPDK